MKHFIKAYRINETLKLMVECPYCNRRPLIGEDDVECFYCNNEIESININAWEEFENSIVTIMDIDEECTCGNPFFGFDCTCEHTKTNPGDIEYNCEFCGIYTASKPRCNRCESSD